MLLAPTLIAPKRPPKPPSSSELDSFHSAKSLLDGCMTELDDINQVSGSLMEQLHADKGRIAQERAELEKSVPEQIEAGLQSAKETSERIKKLSHELSISVDNLSRRQNELEPAVSRLKSLIEEAVYVQNAGNYIRLVSHIGTIISSMEHALHQLNQRKPYSTLLSRALEREKKERAGAEEVKSGKNGKGGKKMVSSQNNDFLEVSEIMSSHLLAPLMKLLEIGTSIKEVRCENLKTLLASNTLSLAKRIEAEFKLFYSASLDILHWPVSMAETAEGTFNEKTLHFFRTSLVLLVKLQESLRLAPISTFDHVSDKIMSKGKLKEKEGEERREKKRNSTSNASSTQDGSIKDSKSQPFDSNSHPESNTQMESASKENQGQWKEQATSIPSLWCIELLVKPLEVRFNFNFRGRESTNRYDRPEWHFTYIRQMIKNHDKFLEFVTSLLHSMGLFAYDAKHEILRGLMPLVKEKLVSDMNQIISLSSSSSSSSQSDLNSSSTIASQPSSSSSSSPLQSSMKGSGSIEGGVQRITPALSKLGSLATGLLPLSVVGSGVGSGGGNSSSQTTTSHSSSLPSSSSSSSSSTVSGLQSNMSLKSSGDRGSNHHHHHHGSTTTTTTTTTTSSNQTLNSLPSRSSSLPLDVVNALLSHTVNEILDFEKTLNDVWEYPRGKKEEEYPRPIEVLARRDFHAMWLKLEVTTMRKHLRAILDAPDAWERQYATIPESDDPSRVPRHCFVIFNVLSILQERYSLLGPGREEQMAEFLEAQISILSDYLDELKDMQSSSLRGLSGLSYLKQTTSLYNAAWYARKSLEEWASQNLYLELFMWHKGISDPDLLSGSVFDSLIQQAKALCKHDLKLLTDKTIKIFESSFLLSYARVNFLETSDELLDSSSPTHSSSSHHHQISPNAEIREEDFDFDPNGEIHQPNRSNQNRSADQSSRSADGPSKGRNPSADGSSSKWRLPPSSSSSSSSSSSPKLDVSPQLCDALFLFREAFNSVEKTLNTKAFRKYWRLLAGVTNTFIYENVIMKKHFNRMGARQLNEDVSAIWLIWRAHTPVPEGFFKETHEAISILSLPPHPFLLLSSLANSIGKHPTPLQLAELESFGLFKLSPSQIRQVLDRRILK